MYNILWSIYILHVTWYIYAHSYRYLKYIVLCGDEKVSIKDCTCKYILLFGDHWLQYFLIFVNLLFSKYL